ncbi:MAG: alpha-amylase family glycosyl hydrolase [bacterium]
MNERNSYFPLEFHILKRARDKYKLDETADEYTVLSHFHAIRLFAQRMNEKRDLKSYPDQTIKACQLNAIGLLEEIWRFVMCRYRQQKNPQAVKNGIEWVAKHFSQDVVNKTITRFVELFPPITVYRGGVFVEEYVKRWSNLEIATSEILLLSLVNNNPALLPFIELFDEAELAKDVPYEAFMGSVFDFFKTQPTFGPQNQHLIELLRAPVIACPNSLTGQLEYIRDNWGGLISSELMKRILLALDWVKEEEKAGFLGPGPSLIPCFEGYEYEEIENFSQDLDWMSKVVLIAKNVYVWLDQLSKKYCRSITRLDQIPDEELNILARWGFTGLWLIGLWKRSPASQKIKQICGNPEAIASAYSIYDYVIEDDLGGEQALENLKYRAFQYGIRLASDMVPNHMGIYSRWTIEHPDWFIQQSYPPFPGYNFTSPDISCDSRVGIYIEAGYWSRTDAAVIFKRVDNWTGDVKYIYHGNDGTSMPWNDTAQLNFLRADVREAVIQMILRVARKFQIIRFDAAMTLTKKHYQRLWFPQPGSGGDIPSRAEHSMSREEFDKLFPKEFWREVVDRVAQEVPDTLLLAEAFWLMEGYFVRTLGMHRVYNSAFMNMLKMEENANYRSVIKKVIEFNPQILKRFVNFMNNPDEQTAIAQFGKGDKYFGVAIMMVTMPGLPMFGHGQIEGFTEKYGMEYKKAYWNEEVDWDLVHRHEAEVFPLMRRRHLFSSVENFVLYDLYTDQGWVNEDVFAYSNRAGDEKVLIIYHNRYACAKGWIHWSAAMSIEGKSQLVQKTLAQALAIRPDSQYYYIFKDYKTGLQYIRQGKELAEKGLYIELGAYHYHVFMDFREVCDDDNYCYARLASSLNGRGVPNMEEAYKEIYLEPVLIPFKQIMNKDMLKGLLEGMQVSSFEQNMQLLLSRIKEFAGGSGDEVKIRGEVMLLLEAILKIERLADVSAGKEYDSAIRYLQSYFPTLKDNEQLPFWRVLLAWLIIQGLGKIKAEVNYEQQSAVWMDEWLLGKIVTRTFQELGCDEQTAKRETRLIKILTAYHSWFDSALAMERIKGMLKDYNVQAYLNFNWHEDTLWLSKEMLEELVYWLFTTSVVNAASEEAALGKKSLPQDIVSRYKMMVKVLLSAEKSGYRVKEMLKMLTAVE